MRPWASQGGAGARTILFCLLALAGVVDRCHAQGYWIQANPPELVIGHRQNVTVTAAGLPVGASDYVCSFRTDIVNPFRGEFEARTSPMRVISPTLAYCEAPTWDLPAVACTLEILKSESLVPKDGSPVTVEFLPVVSGLHPVSGPASGGTDVTVEGLGFDPGAEDDQGYSAIFEGVGGRMATTHDCVAQEDFRAVVCRVPRWGFPAGHTAVRLFRGAVPIQADAPAVYKFEPSCEDISLSAAPAGAPVNLTIAGAGFSRDKRAICEFYGSDDVMQQPARAVVDAASGEISFVCVTPEWRGRGCAAEDGCAIFVTAALVVGDVQTCNTTSFAFLTTWYALGSTVGSAAGGHLLNVSGSGFDPAESDYACRFECSGSMYQSDRTAAVSPTLLTCVVPRVDTMPCVAAVTVVHGDKPLLAVAGEASYTFTSVWISADRSSAPARGGASMIVNGLFESGRKYECGFVAPNVSDPTAAPGLLTTAALRIDAQQLECMTPPWEGSSRSSLSIISDAAPLPRQPDASFPFTFTSNFWTTITPITQLVKGAVTLTFSGSFVAGATDYTCRLDAGVDFRTGSVASTSVQAKTLECNLPEWQPQAASGTKALLFKNGAPVALSGSIVPFRFDAIWTGIVEREVCPASHLAVPHQGRGPTRCLCAELAVRAGPRVGQHDCAHQRVRIFRCRGRVHVPFLHGRLHTIRECYCNLCFNVAAGVHYAALAVRRGRGVG